MANDARENLIAQVRAVQSEIAKLGTAPEKIPLEKLSFERLEEEFVAFSDQLERRRGWLGATKGT